MNELLKTLATATLTFSATNIDDIFILMLFYSQSAAIYPRRAIIGGQYLGFTWLILISLLGFLAGLVVPRPVIGLLGLIPVILGVRAWLNRNKEDENEDEERESVEATGKNSRGLWSATLGVAAVTFANGGDNIGIYTPLFAGSSATDLIIILIVFYILLGVWCFAGYAVSKQPHVAHVLTHYAHYIVPFVLIALGIFIMYESGSFGLLNRM